jgi:hypothetical protein
VTHRQAAAHIPVQYGSAFARPMEKSMTPQRTILYSGPTDGTCLQRAPGLRDLGHAVEHVRAGIPVPTAASYQLLRVAHKLRPHPDIYRANHRLRSLAARRRYDVVWIDKGLSIKRSTLDRLRELLPQASFVAYSPDDMTNAANQSAAGSVRSIATIST